MSNEYGVARFYESKHWSRSGLKEHWLLQPKLQGNQTVNGDFESWSGTEGGCTDCPTNWMCDCTSGGGDINPETTHIYKGSTSVKLDAAGIFGSALLQTKDFLANKVYQISFWCKSEDGVEDLYFLVGKLDITETYRFPTQTWHAGLNVYGMDNISTTWTKVSIYVDAGPVTKLAASMYGFGIIFAQNQGTAVYISDFQIREVETEITGEMGNVLSVGVVTISDPPSFPEWGDSEELLGRVGTGPAGNMGTKFDGVGDHLSRADDGTFDPDADTGHFSFGVRYAIDDITTANQWILAKDTTGGADRGWAFYNATGDDARTIWWDTGGTDDSVNVTGETTNGTLNSYVFSYRFAGDSTSDVNSYFNSSTNSTATGEGPIRNVAAPLTVGSTGNPGSFLGGSVSEITYWNKPLSAIEANKYINPYFPGNNHGDGFYVDTCTQATTWANCSTQKCRDGTPNACQAEGTGVMAVFGSYGELIEDNSFETFTGDDSVANFTHWTQMEVAGDGTAAITAYRPDTFYGDVVARLTTTGTTSYVRMDSVCVAASGGNDHYAYMKMKKLSGTANVSVTVREFSDGACADFVQQQVLTTADTPDVWTEYGTAYTAHATTNSMFFRILSLNSAVDVLVDAISVKEASYRTPWVSSAVGGYDERDYRLHNPLSDYSEELDEYMYESGFCVSAWVYTDWSDDGVTHQFFDVPATAGTSNHLIVQKYNNDTAYFSVRDGAGNPLYTSLGVTTTNWTPNNWKYIEGCTSNAGTVVSHHYNINNSTWYNWTETGAGTGIQDGQSDEFHVGHEGGANFVDGYISEINIVPYSAIFPQTGFNSGKPPVNGKPY